MAERGVGVGTRNFRCGHAEKWCGYTEVLVWFYGSKL